MNDMNFDEKVRNEIKKEIKIPNNIDNIIINNVNLYNKPNEKLSLKNKFIKLLQAIIAILSVFAVTSGAYAAITGNSILSLLGFEKASINFEEKSEIIGRTIDGDNTKVTLNRIACDGSLIILEYEIELKDSFYDILNETEGGKSYINEINNVELGNVNKHINGAMPQEYAKYSEKISENKFMYYEVISIANKNFSNLKLELPVSTLIVNGNKEIDIQKTIYHKEGDYIEYEDTFYVDVSIIEDKEKSIIEDEEIIQKKAGDYTFSIDSVSSTDFGVFALASVKVSGIATGEEEKTNLSISMANKEMNDNLIKVLLRNQITTENDELIDLLYEFSGDNLVFDNRTDIKTNDEDWKNIAYNDGTAELKYILIFPNETDESEFLINLNKISNNNKEETIIANIGIKDVNRTYYKITINEIGTKESDINDYTAYMKNENVGEKIANPYYNSNASKIDLSKFDICGLKLGMSYQSTMEKLEELYKKLGNESLIPYDKITEGQLKPEYYEIKMDNFAEFTYEGFRNYSDDNFAFEFYLDKDGIYRLTRIGCFNASLWNGGNTSEKDIISNYYSEPNYIYNEGVYSEKILYGAEERKKDLESAPYTYDFGDYGYILVIDDKDYNICYYDATNKSKLFLNFDQVTKKITELNLEIIDAQYR